MSGFLDPHCSVTLPLIDHFRFDYLIKNRLKGPNGLFINDITKGGRELRLFVKGMSAWQRGLENVNVCDVIDHWSLNSKNITR